MFFSNRKVFLITLLFFTTTVFGVTINSIELVPLAPMQTNTTSLNA